ncbi:MAG TPA: efflux transporter outer membrane subunit [Steroidobacteraceae bacterium]|jgi:NodT family efflux transporter outer membrane factor (OMF) lipoprotein|nr:efflux transporter outer membrane subunit [Steroidobacteraceae bacterium]
MSSWIRSTARCTAAPAAAALAAAALLSGCVVGPSFTGVKAPQTARYTSAPLSNLTAAEGVTLDSALPPPAQWWSVLDSPQLDVTIRAALAGNRDLAAARARLAQAQELIGVAEAAEYPNVDIDGTAGRVKYGPAFLGPEKLPPFTFYSVGPSVSYTFDYLGGAHRSVEQQRALAQSQGEQLQAAALALSGNVAMQALLAASARSQIDTLQAVLNDDRRNLQLVQDAFTAGGATRVDILNAQSQLTTDQTLMPPLRRELSLAVDALALLVGRPPADWPAPSFQLDQFHLPPQLPLSLPSELAHRRPDIAAAEARLHAATAAVGVASANLYPQISLSGNASFESTALRSLFNIGGIGAGVTAGLTAPLFDHGALRAKQRAAVDEMHAALADYQQAVLGAFRQVADALQGLDHDQELLQSERSALATSTQNLDLTRQSYAAGNSGVLQVLDAQRQNQQARLGLVRAQAQRLQDAVQLLLALGGDLPASQAAAAGSGA